LLRCRCCCFCGTVAKAAECTDNSPVCSPRLGKKSSADIKKPLAHSHTRAQLVLANTHTHTRARTTNTRASDRRPRFILVFLLSVFFCYCFFTSGFEGELILKLLPKVGAPFDGFPSWLEPPAPRKITVSLVFWWRKRWRKNKQRRLANQTRSFSIRKSLFLAFALDYFHFSIILR